MSDFAGREEYFSRLGATHNHAEQLAETFESVPAFLGASFEGKLGAVVGSRQADAIVAEYPDFETFRNRVTFPDLIQLDGVGGTSGGRLAGAYLRTINAPRDVLPADQLASQMGVLDTHPPSIDVIMTVNGGAEISRAVAASPALLGYETGRYRPPEALSVEFCDWPFTNPDALFADHRDVVADEEPRYAVAPDIEGEYDLGTVVEMADELAAHADHVIVVPKDVTPAAVPDRFLLGYPNQPAWGSNDGWWRGSHGNRPVHILGGSPDDQLGVGDYLPVQSVDGANVTSYAEYGRVWTPGRQLERPDLTYYERVRESLGNVCAEWTMRSRGGDGA